jgi:methionyl-tRNA formyltransferase
MNAVKSNFKNKPRKIKVVIFGSFYRGYYVLSELLAEKLSDKVDVVGIATDNSEENFVSPQKRVWQYPHTEAEKSMVENLAEKLGIDIYRGRVKSPEFYEVIEKKWKPDLCIMATFGQKINARLFDAPPLGFYNLHPCMDDGWPSRYVGGNPFQALLDDRKAYTQIAMHRVDDGFDTGELISYSEKIRIPDHVSVIDLHKITSPIAGKLAADEIEKIIDKATENGYFNRSITRDASLCCD